MQRLSIEDIKIKWEDYQLAMGWRILKEGKWKIYKKPDIDGAIRCEMVKLKDYISFPEYLENV
uniref:Uncharacterized protein n=1 Tax=viral metagenome TaxID=1070528 RepID=A0A6H1ZKH9_9ZZZZ